jgi:hypothetical protein
MVIVETGDIHYHGLGTDAPLVKTTVPFASVDCSSSYVFLFIVV